MDEAAYDPFMDAFIDLIEARRLIEHWRDGRPLVISRDGWHRVGVEARSPSDDDWQTVLAWLKNRPEVANGEVGEFVDGWYDGQSGWLFHR